MYTIRTAATRAGVSTEAIRAWERRYGVVHPRRGDNGYRVYDDDDIARLVAMRRLIVAGWSASLAALQVIEHGPLSADVLPSIFDGGSAAGPNDHDLIEQFESAAAAMDGAALEGVLDEMFARGTFERVSEDLVYPSLRALGDRWESGAMSVAAEHAASHAVMRRLSAALDAAGRPDRAGPRVAVGLPPGGRHELGALGFAVAARRAGYAVTYLGADLPVADWVAASSHSDAVVVGVVIPSDVTPALSVAKSVRVTHPQVLIALGGPSAPSGGRHLRLPDGAGAGLSVLANALAAR